jgi:transposase
MDFIPFLQEMLDITNDFGIVNMEKIETPDKIIRIYLNYLPKQYLKDGRLHKLYDLTPEREWQHLSWFDYKCYIICKLPRYVDKDESIKVIVPKFAPKGRSYTHLFCAHTISVLQKVRVQKTVAELVNTTPYIVRSIMEDAVQSALEKRGFVENLVHVSIDEKAYTKGHEYATILIDSDEEYVVDMHEGRKEKSLKTLFKLVTDKESQPQLKRVNIDMWIPYMNTILEIAPQALVVHDKFHLVKKLSEAIDKTRRKELGESTLLKKQKYTVLKNAENRTDIQKQTFEDIEKANLKTAKAWHIRENFKLLFDVVTHRQAKEYFEEWLTKSREQCIFNVNLVLKTFERFTDGILNAITTRTSSGMHENINGRIQSVIAKARGFRNFDRFRINTLFYFGNLKFVSQ